MRSRAPIATPSVACWTDCRARPAGRIESLHAATHSRPSSSAAYFELLDQRLRQICEVPIDGLQTLGEFIDRRLTLARKTCEWSSRQQEALSARLASLSDLLRTRVEIDQRQCAQALLAALDRR